MKKAAPKRSKRDKNIKETKENVAIAIAFIAFMAVLGLLFYYTGFQNPKELVATVDEKQITKEELDWWYTTSVLPEYRDVVTKRHFLENSLIPQVVILLEAEKQGIEVTEEEVEKAMGLYIIENGLTLESFEEHLNSRGISFEDIRNSFKVRAAITKLLEKEGIGYNEFESDSDKKFQEYLDNLLNQSKVEIFRENIDTVTLKHFESTKEGICREKPFAALFTSTKCSLCNETIFIFESAIAEFSGIQAAHWVLDTGDNTLTPGIEEGIPKEDLELFKKYSPEMLVPATVVACKYKRIGTLNKENEYEFKEILKEIIGG